jgi:hypothetical protein
MPRPPRLLSPFCREGTIASRLAVLGSATGILGAAAGSARGAAAAAPAPAVLAPVLGLAAGFALVLEAPGLARDLDAAGFARDLEAAGLARDVDAAGLARALEDEDFAAGLRADDFRPVDEALVVLRLVPPLEEELFLVPDLPLAVLDLRPVLRFRCSAIATHYSRDGSARYRRPAR